MSKPRKKTVLGRVRSDSLIKRMVEADCTPAELAEELGISLSELAAWAADGRNLGAVEQLARLADIRAQMVVSNYRATAAAQLIRIAASSTESDLARKACVDLLDADLNAFDPERQRAADAQDDSNRAAADDVLATLEKIGQQALNDLRGGEEPPNTVAVTR